MSVDELLDADEVFCTGTAVVVSPVGSITHQGRRYTYFVILFYPAVADELMHQLMIPV